MGNTPIPSHAPEPKTLDRLKLIDLVSRVVPCAFFLFIVTTMVSDLYSLIRNQLSGGDAGWGFWTELVARMSTVCFLSLITVLFFIRLEPIEKARGLTPRIQAIAGTFLMAAVTFFPRANLSMWQVFAASTLSLVGTALSIFALAHLGRSFSLMAEARRLVTTGPYRFMRHPLYLFEGMSTFGVLLQHFSAFTAVIFVTHVLIQLARMRNEEMVLQKAFPEYRDYKLRTARLIPKLY